MSQIRIIDFSLTWSIKGGPRLKQFRIDARYVLELSTVYRFFLTKKVYNLISFVEWIDESDL